MKQIEFKIRPNVIDETYFAYYPEFKNRSKHEATCQKNRAKRKAKKKPKY